MGGAAFIHYLADSGMVDLGVVEDVSSAGFNTRFKIQKYAYLAKLCGLNHGHRYSMYRHGPYSPSLAQTYYNLDKAEDATPLPASFDSAHFENIIKERDNQWLEIATTLLDQHRPSRTEQMLLEHVGVIKPWAGSKRIKDVLQDLKDQGLYPS